MNFGSELSGEAVLAIGVFDGVHIGHQKIMSTLTGMARAVKCAPVVMSFEPHPRCVVAPDRAPVLLVSPERRVELLKTCGAAQVLLTPFTPELAMLEPLDFLSAILKTGSFKLRGIAVGRRWHFGRGARGDSETLAGFAALNRLEFIPVEEVVIEGETVSSSSIRAAIASGNLAKASAFLGRPPELSGTVGAGLGIAAGELGRPTANLKLRYGVLPPDGVYAARVRYRDAHYRAALNIGVTPTVSDLGARGRRIEAHLLNFSGDLYDREIAVELVEFIRKERKFASLSELKAQIAADIEKIEAVLGEK